MPRTNTRSTVSLAQQPTPKPNNNHNNIATSTAATSTQLHDVGSSGRRRSSRRTASISTTATTNTTLDTQKTGPKTDSPTKSGQGKRKNKSSSSNMDKPQTEEEEEAARGQRNEAIVGLAKMERRLQRATKRQKLQVRESSCLSENNGTGRVGAMRPRRAAKHDKFYSEDGPDAEPLPTPDSENEDDPAHATLMARPDEEGVVPKEASDGVERGAAREPPVNSDYLPLPWKGRLGYACLNTYLRYSKPSVFSSRTCRMSSIIDHRYPLQDPTQPEHTTKNRPDKTQKPEVARGQRFVQNLGLANARDIVKMLRWNEKYGIRFMRLSSEMFPFASHHEHGYKLAPFASEVLAEAGWVAGQLGHRLTTHPGQFTQLGSPRKEVVIAAVRDLEYHDEMLSLLRLPPQQDRDAVMILHMGGVFGDKAATLERFRQNYTNLLSPSVKARLVLENDDVSWSVHDLLPICEELNIPLVLDYHHHNIIFDRSELREGTYDITHPVIMARISATWRRKNITQKMHYSEPCPGAVTPRDRRKHRPRVATLPPCPPTMDLMIEAKDKEQAVFELMRTFKLPGHERIGDMIPHEREDESRAPVTRKKPKQKKRKAVTADVEGGGDNNTEGEYEVITPGKEVPVVDSGMGGPLGRVYWPPGNEEWLRPRKRDIKRTGTETPQAKAEDDDDDTC